MRSESALLVVSGLSACLSLSVLTPINSAAQHYTYDASGNLSNDVNKQIRYIHYNYLKLADTIIFEDGRKIIYTYTASGQKLRQQAIDSAGQLTRKSDYFGQILYDNDSLRQIRQSKGRAVPILPGNSASPWEYQYEQTDHLNNVRALLTSRQETDNSTATFETENISIEQNQFLYYQDARRINSDWFDHTHNGMTSFSQRLNGSVHEKSGLAKSLSVMPGDVVNLEVFAKYADQDVSHWQPLFAALMSQITTGAIGTVVDGSGYSTSGDTPFPFAGLSGTSTNIDPGPKAYLNWLVFDKHFVFKNGGYKKVNASAKEDGTIVAHDHLSKQLIIKEPGYVYVYLSNEELSPVDVFFDDFTVEFVKGPVVQQIDYDPFGLTFAEATREHSESNNFLYNGKELLADFDLNWYDYGARMYDAALGRWHVTDPLAEKYSNWSPYNYVLNNPVKFVDPDGREVLLGSENKGIAPNAENDKLLISIWRKLVSTPMGHIIYNIADNNNNTTVHVLLVDTDQIKFTEGGKEVICSGLTLSGESGVERQKSNPMMGPLLSKLELSGDGTNQRVVMLAKKAGNEYELTADLGHEIGAHTIIDSPSGDLDHILYGENYQPVIETFVVDYNGYTTAVPNVRASLPDNIPLPGVILARQLGDLAAKDRQAQLPTLTKKQKERMEKDKEFLRRWYHDHY